MPKQGKRTTVIYFVLGLLVGGITGLIAGALLFHDRPGLIVAAAVAGALLFGVLGILFKEHLIEFFPWY